LLTSALDGGEWSASRHGRFIPNVKTSGTHWVWDWVGPRAGLDAGAKTKKNPFTTLAWDRTPIIQPVS